MSESDFELIRRLQEGDRDAVGSLYDRYAPLLYPLMVRITGDRNEADEALVEVWTRAWRESARYDLNRGTVAAWLLGIARSCALSRVPAGAVSGRRGAGDFDADAALADDPDDSPGRRQLAERVRRALGALEPKHRRVLESSFFDGLSTLEIAGRMNAPAVMVRSWTRQALARLRALLPSEEWT